MSQRRSIIILSIILAVLLLPSCDISRKQNMSAAQVAFERGRWAEVIQRSEPLVDDKRTPEAVHKQLGIAYYRTGQYRASITAMDRYLRNGPDRGEAIRWRGSSHYQLSRYDDAYADFELAGTLGYADPDMLMQQAVIARRRRDHATALSCYQRAVELDSTRGDAHLSLGFSKFYFSEYASTILDFQRALRHGTRHPSYLYNNMAHAYDRMGRMDLALACITLAMELDSTSSATWKNLALIRFNQGDTLSACEALQTARALKYPNNNKVEREDTEALIRSLIEQYCTRTAPSDTDEENTHPE